MITSDQIDLAHASAFRLGPFTVEPALRQITATRSETLEPRVMQVLVVLAMANGAIVSRDDLVRQCWEGRIVGDDAINRVIARLRKLAEDHGDGALRIETITKVGYRLVGPVALMQKLPHRPLLVEAAISPAVDDAAREAVVAQPVATPARASRTVLRLWLAGVVTAAFAVVAVVVATRDSGSRSATLPTVVIDPVATDATLPPHFADDLREAIAANFEAGQFAVRRGDGTRAPTALRLSVRGAAMGGGVATQVQLRVPGSDEPVWWNVFRQLPGGGSGISAFALDPAVPDRSTNDRFKYAYEQGAAARQAPRFLETIDYGRKALN